MDVLGQLAMVLHTLECDKEHPDDITLLLKERQEEVCYFYLEETLAEAMKEPDHLLWRKEAESLCSKLSLSPEEIIRLLPQLLEIRRKIDDLIMRYPNAQELVSLFVTHVHI